MPPDVLEDAQPGAHRGDRLSDVGPEVSVVPNACTFAGVGERLARVPAGQDVDGLHLRPVHLGDVAQVGDVGPVVGEDLGRGFVELAEPCGLAAEDGLHTHVESAVAAEQ